MQNEIDDVESDNNSKKKLQQQEIPRIKRKVILFNHMSVDDIEFDDPEYVEARRREELISKRKIEIEQLNKKNNNKQKKGQNAESNNENLKQKLKSDFEDNIEEEDNNNDSKEINNNFDNETWRQQFKIICIKMDNNQIKLDEFDQFLNKLILSLDPSLHELNKERLYDLVQQMFFYYQSLLRIKFTSSALKRNNINKNKLHNESIQVNININLVNLLTKHIFELVFKYGNKSTKKEPSKYVALFKTMLKKINADFMNLKANEKRFPNLDIVIQFYLLILII
jgi:hypothetical protein